MTKAELRKAYTKAREKFANGEAFANEYALLMDTMLADYFDMPLADPPEEETEHG